MMFLNTLFLKNKNKNRSSLSFDNEDNEDNDCIICLSRKSDITLPCTHTYCQECITQWSLQSKECPLCRRESCIESDSWVLTPKPSSKEVLILIAILHLNFNLTFYIFFFFSRWHLISMIM